MIIKLPTLKKEFVNGEIVKTKGELEVEIDTSAFAMLKWEEHFQKTVGYSLEVYTALVQEAIKNNKNDLVSFVSILKLLYCYINSDKLPTFKDFVKLFDIEIADEILNKLKIVFEQLNNSVVSKKN